MLQIPPGGVPWGDAVGWPDAAGAVESDGKAKRTHSWGLDGEGRPTVATGEPAAGLGRHAGISNAKQVYGLLFSNEKNVKQVSADAQAELAYVLAGAGCRPRSKWPTWREGGAPPPVPPLQPPPASPSSSPASPPPAIATLPSSSPSSPSVCASRAPSSLCRFFRLQLPFSRPVTRGVTIVGAEWQPAEGVATAAKGDPSADAAAVSVDD